MTTPNDIKRILQADPDARPFWEAFSQNDAFPESRRVELFHEFIQARREMPSRSRTAHTPHSKGWAGALRDTPSHASPAPRHGTAEYKAHWRGYYEDFDVIRAQEQARLILQMPYEEGVVLGQSETG